MEANKIDKSAILEAIEKSEYRLTSTHSKLCLPIIKRMYGKMSRGIKFDDIKVYDNLIIDGHHRYVSAALAGFELNTIKSAKTRATLEHAWRTVEFVEEEWDSEEKIKHLNEIDAQFNKISLEDLMKITNTI